MKRIARLSALAVALSMMLGTWAGATDQTILGRSFIVKNPGAAEKRKVTGVGKETGSSATIVGDPTVPSSVGGAFPGSPGGAILTIIADGDNPTTQVFPLKQGTSSTGKKFWRSNGGTGFKYKDAKGDQGPVKVVIIKKTVGGIFSIKAVIRGKNGPLNVLPPNDGTDGFMTLLLGGPTGLGDRYCVQFGADGSVKNDGDRLFKVRRPILEGCPGATTTTTTSASTTTTTMPGSPSAAFLDRQLDQLD